MNRLVLAVMLVMTRMAVAGGPSEATIRLPAKIARGVYDWPDGAVTMKVAGTSVGLGGTIAVAGSPRLVKVTLAFDGGESRSFWTELRAGHRYAIHPDPCCFLTVGDEDDRTPYTCKPEDRCPAGTVEVDKFADAGLSCRPQVTCSAPAQLRVLGAGLEVTWDDEPVPGGAYRQVGVGREAPHAVVVKRGGKHVWSGQVVARYGGRYTLDLDAKTGDVRLARDN
jgi:hypothetical protein